MEGIRKAGVLVGARKQLNFIEGSNATITISDSDTVVNCIDITLAGAVGVADVAPVNVDYLVGTANGTLTNEIVVGTSPGGELGGTWATPTVDASHSGSTHAATQAAAESTAAAGITTHEAASDPHTGYLKESNTIDFLVGTATTELAGEIVVGATPGGELGNTWASPTVDASHSGSTHAATQAAAEATAAAANTADIATHAGLADPHTGYRLESADHTHATTGLQGGTITHAVTTGQTATDHHPAPAAGPDANVTVDSAGAAGTASTFARSGHGHQVATSSSAAAAVGTAAAGTSGTAPSRGDHVHPTGAGTPTTQAFGDAATTGSGPAAAMTDHKHAMPADPTTAHVASSDPHTQYLREIERNVYYTDENALTMTTTGTMTQPDRLTISSTNVLSMAGTARMTIQNTTVPKSGLMGSYTPGPFTLNQDDYLFQFKRMNLYTTTRITLNGSGQVILSDLLNHASTGQLVLAGKGR